MEKQKYKFKFTDFIPAGIGMMNYVQRNEDTCLEENREMDVVGRGLILLGYNTGLFLMISALAVYGAFKGLESIVK